MSRISEHPVHEQLSQLRAASSSIPDEIRDGAHGQPSDTLDRLVAVVEHVEAVFAASDPHLLSLGALTSLENALSQVGGYLTSLASDPVDYDYLEHIETALDGVLDALATVGRSPALEAKKIQRIASKFGRTASERSGALEQQAREVTAELERISEAADAAVNQIQTAANEQQATINDEQTRLEQAVTMQETRITQALADIETEAEAAAEKRDKDYANSKERFDESFKAWLAETRDAQTTFHDESHDEIEAIKQHVQGEADEILVKLTEGREEAGKLIDLVATSATAGAFGKEATAQKGEADKWRSWTLRIAGAAAVLALASVLYTLDKGFEWETFLPKLLLTVAVGAIATYAGKQSGDHRRREQRAKRLELELTAFNPMTERLTDEQAQATRISFIERAFVGEQGPEPSAKGAPSNPHTPTPASAILDLLSRLIPGGDRPADPPA